MSYRAKLTENSSVDCRHVASRMVANPPVVRRASAPSVWKLLSSVPPAYSRWTETLIELELREAAVSSGERSAVLNCARDWTTALTPAPTGLGGAGDGGLMGGGGE